MVIGDNLFEILASTRLDTPIKCFFVVICFDRDRPAVECCALFVFGIQTKQLCSLTKIIFEALSISGYLVGILYPYQ